MEAVAPEGLAGGWGKGVQTILHPLSNAGILPPSDVALHKDSQGLALGW